MQLHNERNPHFFFNLGEDGKYRIYCSICSEIAATIDITNLGYIGTLEKSLSPEFKDSLVNWLESKDISELDSKTKDQKILQFGIDIYCGECGKVYCKKHWETRAMFEDSGWYDHTKNVCPEGHSKKIDD